MICMIYGHDTIIHILCMLVGTPLYGGGGGRRDEKQDDGDDDDERGLTAEKRWFMARIYLEIEIYCSVQSKPPRAFSHQNRGLDLGGSYWMRLQSHPCPK